ncbi:hypothetical protein [Nocardiopsis sp. CA-288880]|uniref:hypothetical protein n=1 Tax=Nocardiopsis sp. CA-288880 TaxID=3239995 RepID=UPI003D956499
MAGTGFAAGPVVGLTGLPATEATRSPNGPENLLAAGVDAVAAGSFVLVARACRRLGGGRPPRGRGGPRGPVGAGYGRRMSPDPRGALVVAVGSAAVVDTVFFS